LPVETFLATRTLAICAGPFKPYSSMENHGNTDEPPAVTASSLVAYARATEKDAEPVHALLRACDLPTADLTPAHFLNFFVAKSGGRVIGCVGVEPFGELGLLRSLGVANGFRQGGVGTRLVVEIERLAGQLGLQHLYLLTTTAEPFFASLGYARVPRSDAPVEIKRTREFAELCSSRAVVMHRAVRTH
jgi:amino-acid N-acetyltransferase